MGMYDLNLSLLDTNFGEKLGAAFDPNVIAQKQNALTEAAMGRQLQGMKIAQGMQEMQRAPILQAREDAAYKLQQEDILRKQKEVARQSQLMEVLRNPNVTPAEKHQAFIGLYPEKAAEHEFKAPAVRDFNQPFLPTGEPNIPFQQYQKSLKPVGETAVKPSDILAREKFEWEKTQKAGIGDAEQLGKLQPGFKRVRDPATGEIRDEAIVGSAPYQKTKGQFAQETAAVTNATADADTLIDRVEKLKEHPGLESNFGLRGYVPNIRGTQAADAANMLEELKNSMQLAGFQALRSTTGSPGAMTEREWPKLEAAITMLQNATSVDQAKKALSNVETYAKRIKNVATESYKTEWGGSQFERELKKGGLVEENKQIQPQKGAVGRAAIINKAAELQKASGVAPEDQRGNQLQNKANAAALNQIQKQQTITQPVATSQTIASPQDILAINWAKGNPSDPRAQKILAIHGIKR